MSAKEEAHTGPLRKHYINTTVNSNCPSDSFYVIMAKELFRNNFELCSWQGKPNAKCDLCTVP